MMIAIPSRIYFRSPECIRSYFALTGSSKSASVLFETWDLCVNLPPLWCLFCSQGTIRYLL